MIMDLKLPTAAKHLKDPPRKANYITVQADGTMYLNQKRKLPMPPTCCKPSLGCAPNDPDLNVIIRGDSQTKYRQIRAVLDVCQQANVPKVDLQTVAADGK